MWGQVVGGAGFSDFDAASHLEELPRSAYSVRSTYSVGHPFDCAQGRPVDHAALNARWRQRGDELIAAQAILPGVSRTKPDPELYRAALAALHIRAEEAIVFEDSPNGVRAAKRAGIFVVAVPNPLTTQLFIDGADLTLKTLADVSLIDLLQRVNG